MRLRRKKSLPEPVLLWISIASALAMAGHRIAVTLGDHEIVMGKTSFLTTINSEWVANILAFWALLMMLTACRLWRTSVESQRMVEAIVASVYPDVMLTVSPDRLITGANPAVKAMFGYEADDVLGRTTDVLYADRRIEKRPREIYDHITRYGYHVGEATGLRKSGETFPLEVATSDLKATPGVVVMIRDVTEKRAAMNALLRAREIAESANATKTQFLANMSHELRTPLNSVIGFADVLAESYFGELNEKQREYVNHIATSGKHLLELINDILDLSKVEAGKMELALAPANVAELVKSCTVMIKERAHRHGVQLETVGLETLAQPEVVLDSRKFKQIMFNLLSNAAKFTPDGGAITVKVSDAADRLTVSVTDTGIGIPKEEQEKIFDEFYQVSGGLTDKTPGTGLGLPLTRAFVELHGGKLGVVSEGQGKGSCFTFTLAVTLPGAGDGGKGAAHA